MPYIDQEERQVLDQLIDPLLEEIRTEGQLNYAITRLALGRIKSLGICYDVLAAVTGTMRLAADEVYRRLVVPYENAKAVKNGDLPDVLDIIRKVR